MRRLLLCSGVYGERRGIESLRRFAVDLQPEAVLFAGGILNSQRQTVPCGSSPWGFTREDEHFLQDFSVTLGRLGVLCAVIPSPSFEPMDQLYRWGLAIEREFPLVHVVHATLLEKQGLAVSGLGATIAEEALMREDSYSRVRALYCLRTLRKSAQPHRVLLLPEPPPGALGGEEGNSIIPDIIDEVRPSVCVVGGRTERRGLQRIASTLVVNPGALTDDSAALLDWERTGDDKVELLGK
jgi:hypothetical protein